MKKLSVFLSVFLSLVAANLFSQEENSRMYFPKDSVVVVANRYEINLKNETNSLQIIDGADVSKLATHSVLEAIEWAYPSAFVVDKKILGYGVGTAGGGAVYLRGQGGKPNTGVLMLINGHPDFMGIFGHPLPDVYGLDNVQQIEILSGPASTVFGGNAMGGAINLQTHPSFETPIVFSAEGGSYSTYKSTLQLSRKIENTGFFLTGSYKNSGGHIDQTEFSSLHLQGGIEHKFNSVWNLSAQGRYVPYTFDDPSREGDPVGLGTYGDIKRGMGEIVLANKTQKLAGSTQIYMNRGHHEFYDGFVSDDFTYGLSTYQQWRANAKFSIATGGDFMFYGGKANVDNEKHELNSFGIYAMGLYSPVANLGLKAGARHQHLSTDLNTVTSVLGASYNPAQDVRLFINGQTGFRYPTIQELYLFPPSNSELSEEKIASVEGGFDYNLLTSANVRFTVFRNNVSDRIATVFNPAPPPPVRFMNAEDAKQWGVESLVRFRLYSNVQGQISYSYIDPEQLTAFNPEQQFKYIFSINHKKLSATLFGKYVHNLFADNNEGSKLADYHVLNVSLSYAFPAIELHLKGMNVLDRKYEILPGYEAPGFYLMSGFSYRMK